MKRWFALAAAVVLSIGAVLRDPSAALPQDASVEYQVKALYLFNFAKFVEWPRHAFPAADAPFVICLAGDPFDGSLQKTIQGETVHGRALAVRRLAAGEGAHGCHIIYVSRSEGARSDDIVNAVSNAAILTVGETRDFISNGGMIRFVEAGRRIRFEINPDAAERRSLKVSSRLLRLADIVRPRQRAGNP